MKDYLAHKSKSVSAKNDLLARKLIFFLANLLAIITPFIFTSVNLELFEFNKMLLTYGLTTLIVGLWMLRVILQKKVIFQKSALDIPLLLFVLSQAASTLFSIHPRTSVLGYYTRFHGGLLSTITYALLFWALVNNLSKNQLKTLLLSAVLAGVGVSLYAIPERMGVSPSCILLRGKYDTNCWVQDVRSRVFATFGQPNWLAAYLSMLLPLTISFFLFPLEPPRKVTLSSNALSKAQRIIWHIATGLITIALLFTRSRSGIIAAAVAIGVVGSKELLKIYRKLFFSQRNENVQDNLFSLILTTILLLTLIIGTPFTPSLGSIIDGFGGEIKSNLTTASQESQSIDIADSGILITPSESIRMVVWRGAVRVWRRYFWLGSGPETFAYSYYQDRPISHNHLSEWDFLYNKAHNEFLNLLATTGIVGLSTYLLLAISSLILAFKRLHQQNDQASEQLLTLAALASLLAFHITNFFGFSTVMVSIIWIFVLAYLAAPTIIKNNPPPTKKLSIIQTLSLISLLSIIAHTLLLINQAWQADYFFVKGKSLIEAKEFEPGVKLLQQAVLLSPQEALFYDELANAHAQIALEFLQLDDISSAITFAQLAKQVSDQVLELNPRHLNFYQSRASIFSRLALINQDYLNEALKAVARAQELAPTHPKPVFNQARLEISLGNQQEAINNMLKAIRMKPNYHEARYRLGLLYEENNQCELAKEQYLYILDNIIPDDRHLINKLKMLECTKNSLD